jgi:hypothetical protein
MRGLEDQHLDILFVACFILNPLKVPTSHQKTTLEKITALVNSYRI